MNDLPDAVLCYVDGDTAYFTTQRLDQQWGDDWDDAPYEHSAGEPYSPWWHNESEHVSERGGLCECSICKREWNPDGTPKWSIYKLKFEANMDTPCSHTRNSQYSVEQINQKHYPWLWGGHITIYAGVTMTEFVRLVQLAGGVVYSPMLPTPDAKEREE